MANTPLRETGIALNPSDLHPLLTEKHSLESPGENEGVISSVATPGLVLCHFKRLKTTSDPPAISPRLCLLCLVRLHPPGSPAIFGFFSPGIMSSHFLCCHRGLN